MDWIFGCFSFSGSFLTLSLVLTEAGVLVEVEVVVTRFESFFFDPLFPV